MRSSEYLRMKDSRYASRFGCRRMISAKALERPQRIYRRPIISTDNFHINLAVFLADEFVHHDAAIVDVADGG